MEPKAGIQSTEFLALILLGITVIANGTVWVNIDAGTLNIFIGTVMAYIGQRGYVKGKATDAAKTAAPMTVPYSYPAGQPSFTPTVTATAAP